MVRFGSPDLRTGALGVKRVRGIVSPYSRAEILPTKMQKTIKTFFPGLGLFFAPAGLGSRGGSILWTFFTPSALVRRSGDSNRTILMPKIGFRRLLKSRSPFKVDRIWRPSPIYFKGEVCTHPPLKIDLLKIDPPRERFFKFWLFDPGTT